MTTASAPTLSRWDSTSSRSDGLCVGELFRGAFHSADPGRHVEAIEKRVLPALTVLPYDDAVARVYGEIAAVLEGAGHRLADADLQIAATALHHGLALVTGNVRHFERVPGLGLHRALADAR